MECLFIGLGAYFIQHMGSFNYGKIRTMGAVLVAISIPIFTNQLEKAREATDEANIRSAYAQLSAAVLTEETNSTAKSIGNGIMMKVTKTNSVVTGEVTVKLTQLQDNLQSGAESIDIGGVSVGKAVFQAGKYVKITIKNDGSPTEFVSTDAAIS